MNNDKLIQELFKEDNISSLTDISQFYKLLINGFNTFLVRIDKL